MDSTLIETEAQHSTEHELLPADLTFEICQPAQLPAAKEAWLALEQELDDVPLACKWTWTETWIDCYQHLIDYRIVVGRIGTVVCGACLLSESRLPFAGPVRESALSLGTAGEPERDSVCVEYNAILAHPEHRRQFEAGLFEIVDAQSKWDAFRIDGFSPEDLPQGVSSEAGFEIRTDESLFFDLTQARQADTDALAQLSYNARKIIRKNLRAFGPLTTQWAETKSQAHEIMDDLIDLHQARWQAVGQPGVFASQPFLRFHRQLIEQLQVGVEIGLFRVLAGDKTVGCTHVFIDRNRVLTYQGGTMPLDGKLSPGLVVDYLCIEACLERGFAAFDFLGDVSLHKRRLSTSSGQLLWAVRRRPRLKFALVGAARAMRERWRRLRRSDSSTSDSVQIESQ